MAVDGVDGSSSAQIQQPEQPEQPDDSANAQQSTASTSSTTGTDEAAQSQPQPQQQAQTTQDTYEAPRSAGPVDLSGAPRYDPADYTAASSTSATTEPASGETSSSGGAPVSEAQSVAKAQETERPETAVDPNKVGVALNDEPENLPIGAELERLGVTSARITLNSNNFRPDDNSNVANWRNALDDYRLYGIDVTLNLPRELEGSNSFPIPPAGDVTGKDDEGNPTRNVAPSAEQPQEWKDAFNQWKQDKYLPAVQNVIDKIGTVEGEDGVSRPRVKGYEVWNEPDEQRNSGYAPAIPAQQFGEVLRDVYQKVNGPDADPNAGPVAGRPRITAGGLDSGNPDYLDGAMVDGKLYADTIGVHPYLKQPDASYDPAGEWTGTYQNISDAYRRFEKPLTFTEVGDKRGYSGENVRPGGEARPYPGAAAAAATQLDNVDRAYVFWKDPHDGPFAITQQAGQDQYGRPAYQWRPAAQDLHDRIQQWRARPTE